ncbi:MAG: HTH domain-containing protein [Bacteroidota bacterium]
MALHQIIKRYIEIDELIRSRKSGNADRMAETLGMSKRQVYNYLNALNKIGEFVEFDTINQTYRYSKEIR